MTARCDERVGITWWRRHQPREVPLPYETEASWYYDAGTTGCGFHAVSGYGVANKTLPCGTRLRICNGARCVVAEVDDRGPYVAGRELDLNVATRDAIACDTCQVRWGIAR